MKLINLILLLIFVSINAFSKITKIENDFEHVFSSGSKSKFSKSWSFDQKNNILITPENDLKVYFIEVDFKSDIEKLSFDLWKQINPQFQFKIYQKTNPPSSAGWDQVHQIVYDLPVSEKKIVLTAIRVFKGKAYVNLIEGAVAAFERRGAQFQIAMESWQPVGFQKEILGNRALQKFSVKNQNEFLKFAKNLADKLQIPGFSIAIVEDNKVVFQNTSGVKTLGKKEAIQMDTPFMIGSTTKPMTTLMLAKLVENKKLTWDTPIQTLVPEFSLADKEVSSKVLIRHSACACTGMPRRDLEFIFQSENVKAEDIIHQMSTFKTTTGFGETFQYSNHLVALGGYAGGRAFNKNNDLFLSYEKAMKELVFEPIGMKNTFVKPTVAQSASLPSPHGKDYLGKMQAFPQKMDDMVYSVAPAGSIWSTAQDVAQYMIVEMNKGQNQNGKQVISEEQLNLRKLPGVKLDDTTHYGLGLILENDRGLEIVGHGGNTLGFTSDMFFIPKDKIGMVVLTNAGNANRFTSILRQKLIEIIYGAEIKSKELVEYAIKRQKENAQKTKDLVKFNAKETQWIEKYVGKYQSADLGQLEIKKNPLGYVLDVGEWKSKIGSSKDAKGEKMIALADAPWAGGFEFIVKSEPKRQLILDNGQTKYEFNEVP